MPSYRLQVNGSVQEVAADDPDMPLLYALRNDLGLHAAKFGCGLGQCGACTVLLDGAPTRSCMVSIGSVGNAAIVTLEGIGGPEHPHPVQAAFIAEQAAQCGYCSNGMMLATVALLAGTPHPDDAAIRAALAGNLCRCGTHVRILQAVRRAAEGA
ncbi:MAG: (2Fe-2S)-binding protein [Acetobacteraceae bacterium]|nr:(2Fe-2S)-binding protein [Acetobacteraceae bacterium]